MNDGDDDFKEAGCGCGAIMLLVFFGYLAGLSIARAFHIFKP